jgi:hypothetical protein
MRGTGRAWQDSEDTRASTDRPGADWELYMDMAGEVAD